MHNPKLTIAIITELVTASMIRPFEGLPISLVWSGVNVFLLYGASMTLVRPLDSSGSAQTGSQVGVCSLLCKTGDPTIRRAWRSAH